MATIMQSHMKKIYGKHTERRGRDFYQKQKKMDEKYVFLIYVNSNSWICKCTAMPGQIFQA